MNDGLRSQVVDLAADFEKRGLPYDHVGAIGSGLSHARGRAICAAIPMPCAVLGLKSLRNASDTHKDDKFFCSELVARCFELVAMPLSSMPASFVTPRAIRVSPHVMYVGHLRGGPR